MTDKNYKFSSKMNLVLMAALIIAVAGTVLGLLFKFTPAAGESNTLTSGHIAQFALGCLYTAAILAVVLLVYTWIRFSKMGWFKVLVSLIVTGFIGAIMVVFIYAIVRLPMEDGVFTSMAAVFCYICFNVLLIFENYRAKISADANLPYAEIMERSINELCRPIVLSSCVIYLTLIVAVVVSLITGAYGIVSYVLPLLFSLVIGLALSLFVAGPLFVKMGQKGSVKKATSKKKKASV